MITVAIPTNRPAPNAAAEAAREHARQSDGKFGEQNRGEAANWYDPAADPIPEWKYAGDGTRTGQPFLLTIEPRTPDGDRAGDNITVDVAPVLHRMNFDERTSLFYAADYDTHTTLAVAAEEAGLINTDGEYTVRDIDPDEFEMWLDDNPIWKEDGETPHPTGGYVRVLHDERHIDYVNKAGQSHRVDGPAIVRDFRDDDGCGEQSFHWVVNGAEHRADGPSDVTVKTNKDGTVHVEERWMVDGKYVGERASTYSQAVPGREISPEGVPVIVDPKARRSNPQRSGPRRSWYTPPVFD